MEPPSTLKKNLVETLVFFSPKENHAITAQELKNRFASANTVPARRKTEGRS